MEISLGLAGLIIALITLKLTFFSKPKKELENLKLQFKATQSLSISIKAQLEDIANSQNLWDHPVIEHITFRAYITELEHSQKTNLSDDYYFGLDQLNLSSENIKSMLNSIETQQRALLEIQTSIRLFKTMNT